MPLIAFAVIAYATGLICGFAAMHGVVAFACIAGGVATVATRRGSWLVVAALVIAGDAVATERRWRDVRCLQRLASESTELRAVLLTAAERGSLARARTAEPG